MIGDNDCSNKDVETHASAMPNLGVPHNSHLVRVPVRDE